MKNSKIERCDHTVNFWWGCTFAHYLTGKTREECEHCYALMMAKLFSRGKATWGPTGNRWVRHEAARRELYKLDKSAWKRGVRERVFINSMSDTFEDRDDLNEARGFLWDACKFVTDLDILLLTKRPENVRRMVPESWLTNWPAHVWVGTTAGTQQAADENIPHLLRIPARVRFLSMEPLLGEVNLNRVRFDGMPLGMMFGDKPALHYGIHWIIVGGESGPKARPMHPDWARMLRNQCTWAGVPFMFKQHGEWLADNQRNFRTSGAITWGLVHKSGSFRPCLVSGKRLPGSDVGWRDGEEGTTKVGKAAAGRLLDGKEHNGFPRP